MTYTDLIKTLNSLEVNVVKLILNFDRTLKIKDYNSAKEQLLKLNNANITISNTEFIY